MNKASLFAASGALAFLIAACVPAESGPVASSAPADVVDVRAEMQQHINPAMLGIWDVTNNAMDDQGAIDPSQMDAGKWRQIAAAAEQLAQSGLRMTSPAPLVAASPGNTEVGEGEIPMADVQRHLDSDPRLYRQMASAFAAHSTRLAEAATGQNAAATGDLVAAMDGVCESCHGRFWYPE